MSSKVVAIFGVNGMLGQYVRYELQSKHYVRSIGREGYDILKPRNELEDLLRGVDVVVNCAGLIKQREGTSLADLIAVNTAFPHELATACSKVGANLIHITTDCVFDGKKPPKEKYYETDKLLCMAEDGYGITKALGEPRSACIIRTSIVGEKPGDPSSLLEWAKSQAGKRIQGWTTHYWNGVTCHFLSKKINMIICSGSYWRGVRHITSSEVVTKSKLLHHINDVYSLNLDIVDVPIAPCNRALGERYCSYSGIREQLQEQKDIEKFMCRGAKS